MIESVKILEEITIKLDTIIYAGNDAELISNWSRFNVHFVITLTSYLNELKENNPIETPKPYNSWIEKVLIFVVGICVGILAVASTVIL